MAHTQRGGPHFVHELFKGLIIVTLGDDTFTTLPLLSSGIPATFRFNSRTLLGKRSPQSFNHQGAFDQLVATGAANASYVGYTEPRSWSGFGSQETLSTSKQGPGDCPIQP